MSKLYNFKDIFVASSLSSSSGSYSFSFVFIHGAIVCTGNNYLLSSHVLKTPNVSPSAAGGFLFKRPFRAELTIPLGPESRQAGM